MCENIFRIQDQGKLSLSLKQKPYSIKNNKLNWMRIEMEFVKIYI